MTLLNTIHNHLIHLWKLVRFHWIYRRLGCSKVACDVTCHADQQQDIITRLETLGFSIEPYHVNVEGYREYLRKADYAKWGYYQDELAYNFPEKSLEHFVAAEMLDLQHGETYIDIGNDGCPTPEIYESIYGIMPWKQDLIYRAGLHGNVIGGDAASMPVEDAFADKMSLHCTFEHFESDCDSRFIVECERVLKPGGKVCILPLYLNTEYAIQTDLNCVRPDELPFEKEAVHYCQFGYNNRHGRFYDPDMLGTRVRNHLGGLGLKLFHVMNTHEVDPGCYLKFIALIEKRPGYQG